MAYVPPDPGAIGTTLAQSTGTQVMDTAVELAPIAIPFVIGLAALSWALNKFGVGGKAKLGKK